MVATELAGAEPTEDEADAEPAEEGQLEETTEMRRPLPRPLMPLLECLYRLAK